MKRFLTVFLIVAFSLGLMVVTGCGGGQKVSSVSDEEGQVMDEASQKKKEELPTTYLVEKGDTLATIAEKAEIYGNKYQWPLIFDANRDILDDYKTVAEGQKLIIPRNVSAVEIEAAKQRATELGWPASVKGSAVASSGREEEEGTGEVAGMGAGKGTEKGSSATSSGETSMGAAGEEQPTPIPEPSKPKKPKGGIPMAALIVIILGVLGIIIFFVISQKKKKDEEEEEKEDKSDNILS